MLSLWSPLPVRNGTYPILEAPVDGLVSNMATWLDGILPPKGVDTAVMARDTSSDRESHHSKVAGIRDVGQCDGGDVRGPVE